MLCAVCCVLVLICAVCRVPCVVCCVLCYALCTIVNMCCVVLCAACCVLLLTHTSLSSCEHNRLPSNLMIRATFAGLLPANLLGLLCVGPLRFVHARLRVRAAEYYVNRDGTTHEDKLARKLRRAAAGADRVRGRIDGHSLLQLLDEGGNGTENGGNDGGNKGDVGGAAGDGDGDGGDGGDTGVVSPPLPSLPSMSTKLERSTTIHLKQRAAGGIPVKHEALLRRIVVYVIE